MNWILSTLTKLQSLFEHLPETTDHGRQSSSTIKKRRPTASPRAYNSAPASAGNDKAGNIAVSQPDGKRAMTFPKQSNAPNRKTFPHPLSLSQNHTPLDSPYGKNSPELFSSPSIGSDASVNGVPMSATQPDFTVAGGYQNSALADLQAMMFPSNDPFAYPNEAMTSFENNRQLNQFEPNSAPATSQNVSPRTDMFVPPNPNSIDNSGNLDVQLFGPLPPYMSQNQQQQAFDLSQQQNAHIQAQQQSGLGLSSQANEMMDEGPNNYMSGTLPTTAGWVAAAQSMRTSGIPGMNLDDIFGGEEWNGLLMDQSFRQQ